MFNYSVCPACGHYHDYLEGAFVKDPETGRKYFVCIDCADSGKNRHGFTGRDKRTEAGDNMKLTKADILGLNSKARRFYAEADGQALAELFGTCKSLQEINKTANEVYNLFFDQSEKEKLQGLIELADEQTTHLIYVYACALLQR